MYICFSFSLFLFVPLLVFPGHGHLLSEYICFAAKIHKRKKEYESASCVILDDEINYLAVRISA